MSELTDLEICKRVAEILYSDSERFGWDYSECGKYIIDSKGDEFNPLTDDALCFRLMKKYEVDLTSPYRPNGETLWCADIFIADYSDAISVNDEDPNKVICLAIIEANKDK